MLQDTLTASEIVAVRKSNRLISHVVMYPPRLGMVQEAKVVVGLDFGTTFSGFAYALRSDPNKIYTFYDWPKQAEGSGQSYCKTQTSLLYGMSEENSAFTLRSWGWPAFVEFKSTAVAESALGFDFEVVHDFDLPKEGPQFLTLFKLHLSTTADAAPALPPGMSAKKVITDYLSEMAKFVLQELRNRFGVHITLEDVQWCLTVPAIWAEDAKCEMKLCAELAGLVQGPQNQSGSPHPLNLFIEPEAASVYCQVQSMQEREWRKGDKFLVVDCGGGTVDLVLHEKLGSSPTLSVREVQASSGALCGGSRVDDEFFRFMRRKIPCFSKFEAEHPAIVLDFQKTWTDVKYDFDGENGDVTIDLPPKLASMWENDTLILRRSSSASGSCDVVKITNDEMKSLFDPVVSRVLDLMEERMVPELQVILVVGGFCASPYLMRRIRDAFGGRVASIECPSKPGSAVCCGAVTMGLQSGIVVSRISKKTYGFRQAQPFIAGVHNEEFKVEGDSGQFFCNNVFGKFVRKGDEVRFDDCVKHVYFPISETQDKLKVDLYSSDCESVNFITDVGAKREGTFTVRIPTCEELGFKPKVEVSMFFGRTEIEVSAVGQNFDCEKREMLPVKFERTGIY